MYFKRWNIVNCREYLSCGVDESRVDIGTDSPRRFLVLNVTFRSVRRLGALGPHLKHEKKLLSVSRITVVLF